MLKFSTAVIGGGAAGIVAAISAKRLGKSVVICEKMPYLGKKILASGNGRCNLSNVRIEASSYNPAAWPLIKSIFSKFGKEDIERFFKALGLETYSDGGRIFPITNQAASVLKVLELELKRLAVPAELGFEVADIRRSNDTFLVRSRSNKTISCDRLILAGGGKAYPAFGSDGSCYELARSLGHTIIEPVPAAVPITVKDPLCHALQGQKISAKAASFIDGRLTRQAEGDLIFTKYGLSGTAILDVSEDISVAINRNSGKDVFVAIDMVPFMDGPVLERALSGRIGAGMPCEELLAGILPNKFGPAMRGLLGSKDAARITAALKDKKFKVLGTRGWNECEFTSGGVDTMEVDDRNLESKFARKLFFAGEILDVNGPRGGYNLAWAWASGFVAGAQDGA